MADVRGGCGRARFAAGPGRTALFFPPDPGAAEQSQIGGNVATNAGGPHAFKYGVTGAGDRDRGRGAAGGRDQPRRRDPQGRRRLRRQEPADRVRGDARRDHRRVAAAPGARGAAAGGRVPSRSDRRLRRDRARGTGLQPAALEYLDGGTLAAAGPAFPGGVPEGAGFLVLSEADGSAPEAERLQDELGEALADGALGIHTPRSPHDVDELWRWRDGVSIAVTAQRGGKVSEDIVVPIDRLREAIEETVAIGRRHELEACSWGHAGDGNLHSTFLVAPDDAAGLERARSAAEELFELALRLGGSVSGEHGIGWVKQSGLALQSTEATRSLHEEIKRAFDPKGLLNPGKKAARIPSPGTRSEGPTRP